MKWLKNGLALIGACFLLLAVLIFRPVPVPNSVDKCLVFEGEVQAIYEAGVKDALFVFRDSDRRFYINRGLEYGLDLEDLRENLTGRRVTVYYPKYWTPLDPSNNIKHLSQLNLEGEVIWTEIREN